MSSVNEDKKRHPVSSRGNPVSSVKASKWCHPGHPVSSINKYCQDYSASYTRQNSGSRNPTMSCSEAESHFGDVEEIRSTDRQEEELSERNNARTTVNGAVVSTVHLGRSRGPADASTGSITTTLTSVGPRPCRSGGGQAAMCEDAESFGGYDGRRPWLSEPEEYPAGRIVADRPPQMAPNVGHLFLLPFNRICRPGATETFDESMMMLRFRQSRDRIVIKFKAMLQRKCRPHNLVFSDISFMAILAGVTSSESVKVRHSALASENLTNNQP